MNLGWIPRSRKDLVYSTIGYDAFGEETYGDFDEALQKQNKDGLIRDLSNPSYTAPVTNMTVYIRRG